MPTPTPHQRALGRVLRQLRQDRGLAQESLADRAGLTTNYVGMIERAERNLSFNALWAIAKALDTDCSKLIARVERRLR